MRFNASIKKKGEKSYNLNIRSDFKECVRSVLGKESTEAVLELWTEALQKQNKVLYQFLDDRLGNKSSDTSVFINFTEKNNEG
jgi:pyrroloquinoline quinone (PQQ) biosynthesis protein C